MRLKLFNVLGVFAAILPAVALFPDAAMAQGEVTIGEKHEDKALEEETHWNASAGAILNTGNTKQFSGNAGSDYRMVRGVHGVVNTFALVYGTADLGDGYERNAFNVNGKLRYDYYWSRMNGLFAAAQYRHDRFAGLDHRVQGQLGYQRFLMRVEKHRLWGELGYDITVDRIFQENDILGPDGTSVIGFTRQFDWIDPVHSARVFAGYDNQLNEAVTLTGGLEALINVEDPEDTRVNFNASVNSKLVGALSLEVGLLLQFDNVPPPGVENKLDTATKLNLVYSLI